MRQVRLLGTNWAPEKHFSHEKYLLVLYVCSRASFPGTAGVDGEQARRATRPLPAARGLVDIDFLIFKFTPGSFASLLGDTTQTTTRPTARIDSNWSFNQIQ